MQCFTKSPNSHQVFYTTNSSLLQQPGNLVAGGQLFNLTDEQVYPRFGFEVILSKVTQPVALFSHVCQFELLFTA